MWIEPEMVPIEEALKVSYSDPDGSSVHRVEFSSQRTQDWRISLQVQSDAQDVSEIRVGGSWPHNKKVIRITVTRQEAMLNFCLEG